MRCRIATAWWSAAVGSGVGLKVPPPVDLVGGAERILRSHAVAVVNRQRTFRLSVKRERD
jgi:hypothetical protein